MAMAFSTSGILSSKETDQGGARTSIWQSGWVFFRVINRLCAITMSPTHDGPTTKVFDDCFKALLDVSQPIRMVVSAAMHIVEI